MRLFRGLFQRILVLFVLICVGLGILFLLPLTETVDSNGLAQDAGWMAYLPDSTRLNEITIPGTHNSAAEFAQIPFFTKCQGSSIGEQLKAGFRYLDIRLGIEGETNRMKLMHGAFNCTKNAMPNAESLYLEEVLESCYQFLEMHPTETILFVVKQEHGDENIATFESVLYSTILKNINSWLLTDTIPTLGEARGKLILFRRYEDEARLGYASGIPFCWAEQSGHGNISLNIEGNPNGSYTLFVQDRYEYNNEDKWNAFVNGMMTGASQIRSGNVSLNFLSTKGKLPVGHPYSHAEVLNSSLRNRGENIQGWVVLDFGEPYLARLIYKANFTSSGNNGTVNMSVA